MLACSGRAETMADHGPDPSFPTGPASGPSASATRPRLGSAPEIVADSFAGSIILARARLSGLYIGFFFDQTQGA